jgi:peptide/nickel transport system ATP-binding protein
VPVLGDPADRQSTAVISTSPEAPTSQPLLVADNVVKSFAVRRGLLGRRAFVHAVDGVSLTIHEGEALGLVGETGSGKSTLARVLVRLTSADSGNITFADVDVRKASGVTLKRLRRQMQIVFQDPFGALDPRMRIGTSLEAPLAQHQIGTRSSRPLEVARLLEMVGLDPSLADRYPSECSGGQLQRVVIARALSLGPTLLVCDEPTASLDASIRAQILNVLYELRQRLGLALLIISHDLRVVRHMCDRVAVMYLGEIVEIGTPHEILDHPHHPYTRKLAAAAMLLPESLRGSSSATNDDPPSPINPPAGCRFHPRCPIATQRCSVEPPILREVEPGRVVACHNWDQVSD